MVKKTFLGQINRPLNVCSENPFLIFKCPLRMEAESPAKQNAPAALFYRRPPLTGST